MNIREICEDMISSGRVVKCGDTVKLFNKNGSESKSLKINKQRVYWKISYENKIRHIQLSHLVWLGHGNEIPEGMTVDHIDRNAMNNSIHNLRVATPSEQAANRNCVHFIRSMATYIRDAVSSGKATLRSMERDLKISRRALHKVVRFEYPYNNLLERQR